MTTPLETRSTAGLAARSISRLAAFSDTVVTLFKLRIVALLLFAGAGGAFLAAGGWPGPGALAALALVGGSAAAGASALNQVLEQKEDAAMRRTRRRPLVVGAIPRPGWIPVLALSLIVGPSLIALPFNPALSFWSVAGAIVYVGVYTLWLKPRTVLNIVIGGFAGTCAVISGGAAGGNWAHPGAIVLGLLVFLWTPTHFWSLAILCRDDYARAHVPMLPAVASLRQSAVWVTAHAAATGFAALALGAGLALSWVYWLPVSLATAGLLRRCAQLIAEPAAARARQVFVYSNLYLALVLLLICVTAVI